VPSGPDRLVALGASNLTRGFSSLLRTSTAGSIYGALGHGRSYGIESRFWTRVLPGISRCGIWDALERGPKTRALVTDIGNDVLYGVEVDQILEWVVSCLDKLEALGAEVTITDLPLWNIERLGEVPFLLIRSILVPRSRIPLATVRERAAALNEGVLALAGTRGLRLVRLRPEWYLGDPIHIRPRFWGEAWGEIVGGPIGRRRGVNGLRAYFAPPERQRVLGREAGRPQPVIRFRDGSSVFLY
jgi:hypothetical protein